LEEPAIRTFDPMRCSAGRGRIIIRTIWMLRSATERAVDHGGCDAVGGKGASSKGASFDHFSVSRLSDEIGAIFTVSDASERPCTTVLRKPRRPPVLLSSGILARAIPPLPVFRPIPFIGSSEHLAVKRNCRTTPRAIENAIPRFMT
jgi:hypothetical protein